MPVGLYRVSPRGVKTRAIRALQTTARAVRAAQAAPLAEMGRSRQIPMPARCTRVPPPRVKMRAVRAPQSTALARLTPTARRPTSSGTSTASFRSSSSTSVARPSPTCRTRSTARSRSSRITAGPKPSGATSSRASIASPRARDAARNRGTRQQLFGLSATTLRHRVPQSAGRRPGGLDAGSPQRGGLRSALVFRRQDLPAQRDHVRTRP